VTDRMTTYDFATKTFGHATMLVGGYEGKDIGGALEELRLARARLEAEWEKCRRGEPYDWKFCGHQRPEKKAVK